MNNYKPAFYDLHTHFLPGIDDGSRAPEESLAMLREEVNQGCRGIVGTSHYYPEESIADFAFRREEAIKDLYSWIDSVHAANLPPMCFGAEVFYNPGLLQDPDLGLLCLGQSNYMLLEMPFEEWTPSVLKDVAAFQKTRGISVIIAHLERYYDVTSRESIEELLDQDVFIQMNAGTLVNPKTRKWAIRQVREGLVDLLSTDTHNMGNRAPMMGHAIEVLEDYGQQSEAVRIMHNGLEVFKAAMGDAQ